MKFNLLTILLVLVFCEASVIAQQISIKEIDESNYPFINITIEIPENESIDFSELKIWENKELVATKIDSSFYSRQKKMLCFIIDEALLTNPESKSVISKTLINASNRLDKNDLLNIILTGDKEKTKSCILPLSFEFTADFKGLINQFETSLLTGATNTQIKDLSCTVNEAMDFFKNRSAAPSQKYIVLLKATKSTVDNWPSLKTKADAYLITLSKIELWDKITDLNEQEVLRYAISQLDSLQLASVAGTTNLKSYLLSFYTKQSNTVNSFKLSYKDQEIIATFKKPSEQNFFMQNIIFILVIVFLLLLSSVLAINMVRLRKKRTILSKQKPSTMNRKDANSKIVATSSPQKTNYGSISPYITIELEGQIEKFDLKKLRTTIGRHSDNDILIANLTISNHHAIVTNEGGVFYIQDNDSTNGTFVNDIKITKSMIKPEDSVRLGKAQLYLTY